MVGGMLVVLVGVLCVALGMSVRKGDLRLLAEYHFDRVSDADRAIFGRRVGAGLVLIGIGILLCGGGILVAVAVDRGIFAFVGCGAFAVGMIIGLALISHAIRKYNKGWF